MPLFYLIFELFFIRRGNYRTGARIKRCQLCPGTNKGGCTPACSGIELTAVGILLYGEAAQHVGITFAFGMDAPEREIEQD